MRLSLRPMKTAGFFLVIPLALLMLPFNGRAADEGSALYKEKCAACHGADGKGTTPAGKAMKAPDLTGPEMSKESDDQFADAIQKGKGKMPAMKALSPAQVKELVAYCRHFGKA